MEIDTNKLGNLVAAATAVLASVVERGDDGDDWLSLSKLRINVVPVRQHKARYAAEKAATL